MFFETLIFALAFVLIGAFFFGYPLGWCISRRRLQREFEAENFVYPLSESVKQGKREADILSAEIIEYKSEVEK